MQEFRQCVSSRVDKVRTSAVAASAPFRSLLLLAVSTKGPLRPPPRIQLIRHKRRAPSLIIVSCSTSVFPCTFFHFGSIGSWPVQQSRSASPCFQREQPQTYKRVPLSEEAEADSISRAVREVSHCRIRKLGFSVCIAASVLSVASFGTQFFAPQEAKRETN